MLSWLIRGLPASRARRPATCSGEQPAAMRYGGGTARVLPEGLTMDGAKTRIMNATLAWLYLHEQSNLFQNHGSIGTSSG